MGHAFKITQGDALPVLGGQLLDEYGDPILLAAASQVQFLMRASGIASFHIATGALWSTGVSGPSAGHAEYPWAAAGHDTPTVGFYEARFRITWPGSRLQSVPNPGFHPVTITE